MYGYYEYANITPEQLLQKVDQTKIFEFVLKQPVNFENRYISPFRKDKNPGCFFTQREDGIILFVDFADRSGHTHRSCFRMVMDNYNPVLTVPEAVNLICSHFKISKNSEDYAPVEKTYSTEDKESSEETIITFIKKPYDKYDKRYWSQFLISIDDLKEDNVYSIYKATKVNKKGRNVIVPYGLSYALDFLNHVKLYMPNNNPKFKWITNCTENDIGNIDNLPFKSKRLIITKSYKDHRVIRNLTTHNVIWLQNEGCVPDEDILLMLLSRFEEITIFFDNDYTGIKQGYKLVKILRELSKGSNDVNMTYLPISCKHKDMGEYVSKEGRQDTLKILKQIRL